MTNTPRRINEMCDVYSTIYELKDTYSFSFEHYEDYWMAIINERPRVDYRSLNAIGNNIHSAFANVMRKLEERLEEERKFMEMTYGH